MQEKSIVCLGQHFKVLYEHVTEREAASLALACITCPYFKGSLSCNHHIEVMRELAEVGIDISPRKEQRTV